MRIAAVFCFVTSFFLFGAATYWKYGKAEADRLLVNKGSVLEMTAYSVASTWLRWSGLYPVVIGYLPQIVRYCGVLQGHHSRTDPAYLWTVKVFTAFVLCLLGAASSFVAAVDPSMGLIFLLLAVFLPIVLYRELAAKVIRRQEAFISELPSFMHKLSLLIAAGEPLQRAWIRAGTVPEAMRKHPLYAELSRTNNVLEQAVPFPKALEELHHRSDISEMGTLVTTVLMNYKRGGEAFSLALQDASRSIMERKYALIRKKGEEASTKLLLPMMLMLGSVIFIVGTPAFMMMY